MTDFSPLPPPQNAPLPPPIPEPFGEISRRATPDFAPQNPAPDKREFFAKTVKEGLLLILFNAFFGAILHALHLRFFLPSDANSGALAEVMKKPLLMFLLAVIVAPLWEELVFRGVPSLLVRGVWKLRAWSADARENWYWGFGTVAAFLFAVAHGLGDKTPHLPLPQLLMGFFLWRAAMTRGLRYSMLLHATYNFVPFLLILAFGDKIK